MRNSIITAGFLLLNCGFAWAAADCQGDTRQEHHIGNFDFVTSSWVEPAGERMRYVSCVANLDEGSDLLVHWFIPGPYRSYVPSSRAVPTPRLRDDVNPRPVTGCLQFGQLGEMTKAEFLGTGEDEEENGDGDCKRQAAENWILNAAALPDKGYADDIVVYFPSDSKDPRNTMLELRGKIGIMPKGSTYQSFFHYQVNRLAGREKGNISDVRVEPFFPGKAEFAYSFYKESIGDFSKLLKPADNITFNVIGEFSDQWRVVEAYYKFIDRNNEVVAFVSLPLLLEDIK